MASPLTQRGTRVTAVVRALRDDVDAIRNAFRKARLNAETPRTSSYVDNLVRRLEEGHLKLGEHTIELAWDAFIRGAPQEDVESPGHAYLAVVRSWYGSQTSEFACMFAELVRLQEEETRTQGLADDVQMRLQADPRNPVLHAEAERAGSVHNIALGKLLHHLRQLIHASHYTNGSANGNGRKVLVTTLA